MARVIKRTRPKRARYPEERLFTPERKVQDPSTYARGPGAGRPPIGPIVRVRMPVEMIDQIDQIRLQSEGDRKPSRAEWVRGVITLHLQATE